MNVFSRFSTALFSAEVELARSLPVFDGKNEILFLYSVVPQEKGYRYERIHHVFFRNCDTNQIEDIKPEDVFASTVIKKFEGAAAVSFDSVEDELAAEQAYLDHYEEMIKDFAESGLTAEEIKSEQLKALQNVVRTPEFMNIYLSLI